MKARPDQTISRSVHDPLASFNRLLVQGKKVRQHKLTHASRNFLFDLLAKLRVEILLVLTDRRVKPLLRGRGQGRHQLRLPQGLTNLFEFYQRSGEFSFTFGSAPCLRLSVPTPHVIYECSWLRLLAPWMWPPRSDSN